MGAFDYGKTVQQKVALLGKESTNGRLFAAAPQGAKAYSFTPTAGVFKKALEIFGSGALNFCSAMINGATADTFKLRVTVDGRIIYNASCSTSSTNWGFVAVGAVHNDSTNGITSYGIQRIPFEKSLLVEATTTTGQYLSVFADYEVNV